MTQTRRASVGSFQAVLAESQGRGPFEIGPDRLQELFDPKNPGLLQTFGGAHGICQALNVDPAQGLEDAPKDSEDRKRVFGQNNLPPGKALSFLELMWLAAHDKTLLVLSVAAILSLSLGIYQDVSNADPTEPRIHWVEGATIVLTVLIVILVSSLNDYQKEKQFQKLNAVKEDRDFVVLRSGEHRSISIYDLLVGDIGLLSPGDMLPVDGVLLEQANLRADESSATGESDTIRKSLDSDPFVLSGTSITDGSGKFVVCSVGVHSFHGKTMMSLRAEADPQTPMEEKLDGLADKIARFGVLAATLMFVSVVVKYVIVTLVTGRGFGPDCAKQECPAEVLSALLETFISAVAVICVAVPEGLPLAVTLALAYGTSKMLESHNLVRVLSACETMGAVTTLLSDKTGTLTENRMTVVKGFLGSSVEFEGLEELAKLEPNDTDEEEPHFGSSEPPSNIRSLVTILQESISLNSSAFTRISKQDSGKKEIVGSKTETALLDFVNKLGGPGKDWEQTRHSYQKSIVHTYPFSSWTKCMATIVKFLDGDVLFYRIYVTGAAEMILSSCESIPCLGADAKLEQLSEKREKELRHDVIDRYARETLRTICLAYRDLSEGEFESFLESKGSELGDGLENGTSAERSTEAILESRTSFEELVLAKNLTFLAIVGIQDPLREGVSRAISLIQNCAGVRVRMVTGDNELTAKAIAESCGIYRDGDVAMKGTEFRQLVKEGKPLDDVLDRLSVMSRSSPADKQTLVRLLQERGEVVGVTGDGTNDAPALKLADIGLSMGKSGTEVAKEASDIVLMEDSVESVVKAIMWGRAINDSVKKFLQFQLTVNVTATILAFTSALADGNQQSILTAVQLLWVNLANDTLAGLALATEEPTEEVLKRPPEKRESPLITGSMWKMIGFESFFQVAVSFVLLFGGPWIFGFSNLASVGGIVTDLNTVVPPPNFPGSPEEFSDLCWAEKAQLRSIIFNTFVFMQLGNEFNCRRLGDSKLNVFSNILNHRTFILVVLFVVAAQAIIMSFGGIVFRVTDLSVVEWAISIGLGVLALPVGVIARLLPYPRQPSHEAAEATASNVPSRAESEVTIAVPQPDDTSNIPKAVSPAPSSTPTTTSKCPLDFNQVRRPRPALSQARSRWSMIQDTIRLRRYLPPPVSEGEDREPLVSGMASAGESASLDMPSDTTD